MKKLLAFWIILLQKGCNCKPTLITQDHLQKLIRSTSRGGGGRLPTFEHRRSGSRVPGNSELTSPRLFFLSFFLALLVLSSLPSLAFWLRLRSLFPRAGSQGAASKIADSPPLQKRLRSPVNHLAFLPSFPSSASLSPLQFTFSEPIAASDAVGTFHQYDQYYNTASPNYNSG